MSLTISFNSLKGGVGKTTSSILFINELSSRGKKLLIIDLDPQYSLSTYFLEGNSDPNKGVFHYLIHTHEKLNNMIVCVEDNIDLLSSSIDLINMNTNRKFQKNPLILKKKLMRDKAFEIYDFIIIDTPPTFSFMNLISFPFVDFLFLVTLPEIWSIRAISVFMAQMKTHLRTMPSQIKDVCLLLNFLNKNIKAEILIVEALEKKYPDILVKEYIPYSRALMNNILYKKKNDRYLKPIKEVIKIIIDQKLERING